jgi:hypothetical protein
MAQDSKRVVAHESLGRQALAAAGSARKDLVMATRMIKALKRFFADHPASVGETYWQHAHHSALFGIAMLRGAGAAFIHAVFPALCTTTGSRIIGRLHDRMILNRSRVKSTARENPAEEHYIAEHI